MRLTLFFVTLGLLLVTHFNSPLGASELPPDNARSMADGCELSSAEFAATRADLRIRPGSFVLKLIGKDGSVKLTASNTTSMKEIYALIDTMPMRREEISKR